MDQDLALIEKFKCGELEGFEMLVKKYQNMVVNIAYSLIGNLTDAQDVAQEVFMKIYNSIGSFRAQAKFSSWLYRVTVNSAYDHLRRRKKNTTSLDEFEYAYIPENKEKGDILAKELIHKALKKIPFEYRSALVLKELKGLSYQEIADSLKISLGTVESRIFRARATLKEILTKIGVFKDEV